MKSLKLYLTICLVGLFSTTSYSQEVFESVDGSYSTRKLTLEQDIGSSKTLIIRAAENLPGKISIITGKTNDVKVMYFKKARAEKKDRAIDYIDLIAVVLDHIPEGSRLEMRAPNPAPWEGGTEWGLLEAEIIVPAKSFVQIEASQFDVFASGPFNGVVIPSSLGKIEVSNVLEKLEIATLNRRVTISDISGNISVSTTNAQLLARNIAAIDERAEFENENGDIKIEGLTGEVSIDNRYGRIYVSRFSVQGQQNLVRGMSGPILLEIVEAGDARLRVTNRYDDIELNLSEDISAELSLVVDEGGKIDVSDILVRPELIEHNRMNLVTGKGGSVISSSVRGSGNIFVKGGR